MTSRRKATLAVFLVLILLLCLFFAYLFLQKAPTPQGSSQPGQNCLIFQGADSSKPCFVSGWNAGTTILPVPSGSTGTVGTTTLVLTGSSTQGATLSPAAKQAVSSCDSPISIENVACVKALAAQSKDSSICSAIVGDFDRNDCLGLVSKGPQKTADISGGALKSYDFSSDFSNAGTPSPSSSSVSGDSGLSSAFTNMLSALADAVKNATDHPDPRFTAEGFYERMAAHAKLALYAFSDYQVAPGTSLTAQGSGFAPTGNTLHIGSYAISNLSSSDSVTLSFTAPSLPDGQYEGWVENANGTSQVAGRKIMLFITQNPAPRPLITSYSPANPTATDTITFTGSGFSSSVNAYTSLGNATLSSNGGTFSLRAADLQYYPKIKDALGVKGNKLSLFIYIQNGNGISKDPFTFDVQF